MPSASTLLLFTGASLALIALPGPAVIFLITRSVDQGRRAGIISMLGVETGTFAYALAAVAGLAGLLAASATAFNAVKYAGAAYLIVLGIRKLVRPHTNGEDRPAVVARRRLYLNGLIVQLLNPKIAIFFVAFLPQFVDRSRGSAGLQTLVLGTLFTVFAVLSDGSYVLLADTLGRWLRRGADSRRRLDRLSGGVYVGLGVTAALTGRAR